MKKWLEFLWSILAFTVIVFLISSCKSINPCEDSVDTKECFEFCRDNQNDKICKQIVNQEDGQCGDFENEGRLENLIEQALTNEELKTKVDNLPNSGKFKPPALYLLPINNNDQTT